MSLDPFRIFLLSGEQLTLVALSAPLWTLLMLVSPMRLPVGAFFSRYAEMSSDSLRLRMLERNFVRAFWMASTRA